MKKIKKVTFDKNLMATTIFEIVDYCDCFEVEVSGLSTIDAFVKNYFLAQPFCLRVVSFELFRKTILKKQLNVHAFKKGDVIGAWKVYGRDEKEIAFGQDMGFMAYVCTFHLVNKNLIKVATIVHFKSSLGKYYFAFVKLLHKPFLKYSLGNTLKALEG